MNEPVNKQLDNLMGEYKIGFQVGDKDIKEHYAKFKQSILDLIASEKVKELEQLEIEIDKKFRNVREYGGGMFQREGEISRQTKVIKNVRNVMKRRIADRIKTIKENK